ncbi:putative transcriptional regulator, Crp/Fnr family [Pseudopedobacter saltans DSM 12145]|uniref:Transcriptional regulator, Crp/Fnr family n=1 Tax=Pseudopedobacter saltans (strain ATCC 51119 / DSM 12145 / JCM 21818 / CCUG 39354 / LMG 10337 / NBRC 100064 / NCIMB 13643) TaxID=762903 RepID=F0SE29_PSESL|nr:helix-turn-helix domain-containing protein [Pseudopedobacter saltans]ADY52955.1 putative transcriptional regulator, Crp/Fnr family [Pseudopedobacter saltans DSM 12145]
MNYSAETLKELLVNQVLQHFAQLHPLNEALQKEVHEYAYILTLKSGEVLLEQGDYCNTLYMVCQGLLICESSRNGKTITTWFSKPGDCATSVSGLYGMAPSAERMYAYTETILVAIDVKYMQRWYELYPESNIIMRKMFERHFQGAQNRASVVRMGTAKEKYQYYKNSQPDYVAAAPVAVVASYLGMKTSTLENIIKEEERQLQKDASIEEEYRQLLQYLETDKLYLQNSLTLKGFALILGKSTHRLSELINKKSGKNFNDFINSYRIAYIQERLKNKEEWQHLTLEALGMEAGFKSRSSFFAVFKKHLRISPSVYMTQKEEGVFSS